MSGRFLLDTNIVIGLFEHDKSVTEGLKQADEVFIASTVLGELYFGARKSGHVKANLDRIDDFAAHSTILGVDIETARRYGEIKHKLREKGRPLPENDIWIAAIALQHGLKLATRDDHFREIEGLQIEGW